MTNVDSKITRHPNDVLTDSDKAYIKSWVKENFKQNEMPNTFWHPYVKDLWRKYQEKSDLLEKLKGLERDSKDIS